MKSALYFWITIIILTWFSLLGYSSAIADKSPLKIGNFSQNDISGWQQKVFSGNTSYSLVPAGDLIALKAVSRGTASGYIKSVRIDLNKTPVLNWSWKIENTLQVADEKTKAGDDYPARIYVIHKTGLWPWDMIALNYVWSSTNRKGTDWPNAFTQKAWMVAVASPVDHKGEWKTEKRNVQLDFKKYFNKEIQYIDAVAIMTDTDNSKTSAVAYYGDIYFSAR